MQFVAIFNEIQYVIAAKSTHSFSLYSFFSIFKVTIKDIEFITIVLLAIVFNTLSNIKEYYDIMVIVYLVKYLSLSNHVFHSRRRLKPH